MGTNPAVNQKSRFAWLMLAALPCFMLTQTNDASACSPAPPNLSVSERYANASAVFHAHVTKTEISAEHPFIVEATFRVAEAFKGVPPAKVRSSVFRPGACGYPLLVGIDYLFFLADGQIDVRLNDNSVGDFIPEQPQAQKFLTEIRALAK
jgi:hypothetical protein